MLTLEELRDVSEFRAALGCGGSGGSCFGVSDPSRLRAPLSMDRERIEPEPGERVAHLRKITNPVTGDTRWEHVPATEVESNK